MKSSTPHRKQNRGFTLIELMMVVAIIAILASVAVPMLQSFTLRSKTAERDLVMEGIEHSLIDYIGSNDQFPHGFAGFSFLFAPQNPPSPPGQLKQHWVPNYSDWTYISSQPQSDVYYQYLVLAETSPGFSFFIVEAIGDLDGDGHPSIVTHEWWNIQGTTKGWEPNMATYVQPPVAIF